MATDDFFRARLDAMIDLKHPLAVLSTRLPWAAIEAGSMPFSVESDIHITPVWARRRGGRGDA